jgi:hypothetical protein
MDGRLLRGVALAKRLFFSSGGRFALRATIDFSMTSIGRELDAIFDSALAPAGSVSARNGHQP